MTERYRLLGATRRWQRYRTFTRLTDARREAQRFTGQYNYRLTKTKKGYTIYLRKK
tara:strand:- start:468 stop:635 length:168 start_codon:yes stop_codon:yes gene_type:complete